MSGLWGLVYVGKYASSFPKDAHKVTQIARLVDQYAFYYKMGSQQAQRHDSLVEQVRNLPDGLQQELRRLDELFWVGTDKLKEISDRFGEELAEGLEEEGRNISMNLTWVFGFPTGHERGSFLTIDLGGTNIRACWIELAERKGETKVNQHQYKLPGDLKTGSAEQLWDFIADSVEKFISNNDIKASKDAPLPLGFTFSYPAIQHFIDHGILQTWTKGWDIEGVEGEDVAKHVSDAFAKRKLPVELVALINDTTGAMIASAYNDPDTIIGAIFGTGCNAAYMEHCGSIPKLKQHAQSKDIGPEDRMAINCEYGAFDNAHEVLPITPYDETVDKQSPRPGEQAFEKMSAGLYLGEIFRLVVLELHSKQLVFKSHESLHRIQEPYSFDTAALSRIENDESADMAEARDLLKQDFHMDATPEDLQALQHLAIMIAVRGARLCACGIAALCRKTGTRTGHVAADGSVANKHPRFKKRWSQALGEILDWPEDGSDGEAPITLTSAEDGSGIGAAVIAAMTMERAKRGNHVGIRADITA